uniref:Major facilitator superfamily (MFS) profile domain-containing protein n=1 Tax=Ditylenchus dipsaci TaxID=166011 RepID=A0A915DZ69_9BILA
MMVHINRAKLLVFSLTFVSYALYHAARKNLSGVKSSISADWLTNGTAYHPHPPLFPSMAEAQTFLGTLDALFMICYAGALIYWGWLGDRLNPRNVVVFGMVASALTLILFGSVPHWTNFYSIPYYVVIYALFGIVQACGWPNVVAVMANWFPKPIVVVISSVLPFGYQYTFAFNSMLILIGAFLLTLCVEPRPPVNENPGLIGGGEDIRNGIGRHLSEEPLPLRSSTDSRPVSMCEALLLPSVLPYCLCNACLKFVNYAFFFWLPYYLTYKFTWEESEANRLSIFYDVGGIVGSIVGGFISDRIHHRSPVLMTMLVVSLPLLFFYATLGANRWLHVVIMTLLGVTISGPYNLIVGTIAVDLGSQPGLAGNTEAMSTVTGLIDGTGSAGSAIGQLFVPIIQNKVGWAWVFYLFIVMNTLASACLSKRFSMTV